jgi:prepilin-type processing-associated H-X9-DG protein/prepilin-type N-terminal cleavage/methylation domain-containing protein
MTKFKNSSEFVKALLAQEPILDGSAYAEHRRKLLDRLAGAERRERRGRYISIGAVIIVFVILSALYSVAVLGIAKTESWPDWAKYTLMLFVILLPFSALLLITIYFFRHYRELRQARDHVYRSALLDLPRQIEELRSQVEELRGRRGSPSPEATPPDKQGAFTLFEMLVTVGILGLLASLLFPALSHAKAQARLIQCKSNLSQIGKALIMYEGETGSYPAAGLPVLKTDRTLIRTDDSWDMRLFPLVANNSNVFSCPSRSPGFEAGLKKDAYGYNAWGSSTIHDFSQNLGLGSGMTNSAHPVVRSSDVRSPADMVAVGDLQMPPGLWINTITPNTPMPLGGLNSVIADRHRGGANMVFCDGHVEFSKQPRWIEATDSARRRWNNDNAPHRETWR